MYWEMEVKKVEIEKLEQGKGMRGNMVCKGIGWKRKL